MFRGRLFIAATAVSLLALIATGVLWARSYGRSDHLVWTGEHVRHSVRSAPGQVVLGLYQGPAQMRDPRGLKYERDEPTPATLELMTIYLLCSDSSARVVHWEHGGFVWQQRRSSRDLIATGVAPFWSLSLASAAPALGWVTMRLQSARRRRNNKAAGRCAVCGYDLRGTPERCPECGTFRHLVSTSG